MARVLDVSRLRLGAAMVRWFEERMCGFDLETTATEPEEARIVSAAVAFCGGGLEIEETTWLADPGVPIPDEAAAVHGITTERAQAEGRPAAEVIREITEVLAVAAARGIPIVVFNARYDLTVLDRECRRHGIPPLSDRQIDLLIFDPLVVDKWLDRYRKGSRKLEAICAHYGATLEGAHDATFDAVAACRTAWVLGAKGRVVRRDDWPAAAKEKMECVAEWAAVRDDLPALYLAQVRWAIDQALGLQEHFRETGNPDADTVRVEWPIVPPDPTEPQTTIEECLTP
jgi:DNA polymerase III epsilon subunit-like protein